MGAAMSGSYAVLIFGDRHDRMGPFEPHRGSVPHCGPEAYRFLERNKATVFCFFCLGEGELVIIINHPIRSRIYNLYLGGVLSHEQMNKQSPFSVLNIEQTSNWLGVKQALLYMYVYIYIHDIYMCIFIYIYTISPCL